MLKAQAQAKEAKAEPELITTLEELARLADKPTGGKFTKAVTDFAAQLIKVEGEDRPGINMASEPIGKGASNRCSCA